MGQGWFIPRVVQGGVGPQQVILLNAALLPASQYRRQMGQACQGMAWTEWTTEEIQITRSCIALRLTPPRIGGVIRWQLNHIDSSPVTRAQESGCHVTQGWAHPPVTGTCRKRTLACSLWYDYILCCDQMRLQYAVSVPVILSQPIQEELT